MPTVAAVPPPAEKVSGPPPAQGAAQSASPAQGAAQSTAPAGGGATKAAAASASTPFAHVLGRRMTDKGAAHGQPATTPVQGTNLPSAGNKLPLTAANAAPVVADVVVGSAKPGDKAKTSHVDQGSSAVIIPGLPSPIGALATGAEVGANGAATAAGTAEVGTAAAGIAKAGAKPAAQQQATTAQTAATLSALQGANDTNAGNELADAIQQFIDGVVDDPQGTTAKRDALANFTAVAAHLTGQSADHSGSNTPSILSALDPATLLAATSPLSQAAPAQAATTAAPAAHAGLSINVPPGQPGWSDAVGTHVNWLIQQNQQGAQIRLNPPHLGPLEVKVAVHNDQASVSFTVHHAFTADQLQAALPRLRDMLAQNGLNLSQFDVHHQATGGQGQNSAHGGGATASHTGDAVIEESAATGAIAARTVQGLLDTYA